MTVFDPHPGPASATRHTAAARHALHRRQTPPSGKTAHWTVLLSAFAATMMAVVVEVYYADLVPEAAVPHRAHFQAFAAACAGFLPTMLCLERLSAGSWWRAARLTAPWLLLVPDALFASLCEPTWYALAITTALIAGAAWFSMQHIARRWHNT